MRIDLSVVFCSKFSCKYFVKCSNFNNDNERSENLNTDIYSDNFLIDKFTFFCRRRQLQKQIGQRKKLNTILYISLLAMLMKH